MTSLLTITTHPTESPATIRSLLTSNLFVVFDNYSSPSRAAAIQSTYHPDIVWYEEDRVIIGHDALNSRAAELQNRAPGFSFNADGEMIVCTENF
jgi:hypothetical protein